jgi:hypothetical protein
MDLFLITKGKFSGKPGLGGCNGSKVSQPRKNFTESESVKRNIALCCSERQYEDKKVYPGNQKPGYLFS